jgi:outer membrane protein TolC
MDTLAQLTLTQPLLGGSGALVAREPLTQAERNLIYALRTYVRTRSALLIQIATDYYDVLNAEADLRIGEMSYESLKYSRERSEAMGEGGRVTQIDVDQAKQRVLTAESNLVTYREAIQNAKDALKVALAIPLSTEIEVDSRDMEILQTMTLPRPTMTLDEAVETALRQRLDFATVRDRLADAERAVAIAEDDMRMKLDVSASATASSPTRNRISTPRFADADYSVGLDVDLPLDRTDEAIALKRAQIALEQQRRQIDASRENLVKSLRLTWNNLRAYELKINIQKISIALAEKRVENTRLLFEDGRIAIREYLDAQDDLSNARNSLIQQLVSHRMCWLKFLHELEELHVDPVTFWTPRLEVTGN